MEEGAAVVAVGVVLVADAAVVVVGLLPSSGGDTDRCGVMISGTGRG